MGTVRTIYPGHLTAVAGQLCEPLEVTRGASFGDIDNDGDTDIIISNNSGPARLYTNNVGNDQHWLGVQLQAGDLATPRVQCRLEFHLSNGVILHRTPRTDGSYLSVNDPRILVGLGSHNTDVQVTVHWNNGNTERFEGIAADQYVTISQGQGTAAKARETDE